MLKGTGKFPTTQKYLIQNISRGEFEKPWYNGRW